MVELCKHGGHRGVGVAEEYASPDANESPTKPFENSLAFQIMLELLRRVPSLTVAFDSEALGLALDNEVNPARTHRPLRMHAIASADEALEHELLENGIRPFALFLHCTHKRL